MLFLTTFWNYQREFSTRWRQSEYGLDGVSSLNAERDYRKAVDARPAKKQADLLNAWCEQYLSSEEWTKLKAAIRKRRERWERGANQLKSVTISPKAHKLLVQVTERDEVTQSEVLEHYLAQTLNRSRRRKYRRR